MKPVQLKRSIFALLAILGRTLWILWQRQCGRGVLRGQPRACRKMLSRSGHTINEGFLLAHKTASVLTYSSTFLIPGVHLRGGIADGLWSLTGRSRSSHRSDLHCAHGALSTSCLSLTVLWSNLNRPSDPAHQVRLGIKNGSKDGVSHAEF